jgi:hypothetical protein
MLLAEPDQPLTSELQAFAEKHKLKASEDMCPPDRAEFILRADLAETMPTILKEIEQM